MIADKELIIDALKLYIIHGENKITAAEYYESLTNETFRCIITEAHVPKCAVCNHPLTLAIYLSNRTRWTYCNRCSRRRGNPLSEKQAMSFMKELGYE